MYHAILDLLISAILPASTERTAIRLLALAHPDNGALTLSWPDYCTLAGNRNINSARRHLTALSKAGVLHYSTNDQVYIQFLAWTPDIETARGRAVSDQPDIQTARGRAVSDQPDIQTARGRAAGSAPTRSPHTRAVGGGGPSTDQPISSTTTNHPPGIRTRLRGLGVNPDQVRIHMSLTVHDVTAILDAWEADLRAGKVGIGALIHRLQNAITPPDVERLRQKNYRPAEFQDVIR